ncbi:hypothetical protein D1AOALGA4SA_627 [Olavius algarvensis Delta 1 endosymbiont]|nr:hypothetical protein D1AOALGA4SA_627 [Olavius algarvensis Delta 1 endosymbiont]
MRTEECRLTESSGGLIYIMLRIFMFFLLIIITTNRPFMNCVDLFQSETLI